MDDTFLLINPFVDRRVYSVTFSWFLDSVTHSLDSHNGFLPAWNNNDIESRHDFIDIDIDR